MKWLLYVGMAVTLLVRAAARELAGPPDNIAEPGNGILTLAPAWSTTDVAHGRAFAVRRSDRQSG